MKSQPSDRWFRQREPRKRMNSINKISKRAALAVCLGALAMTALLSVPLSGAQDLVSELQAEFIGRFPQFIEWPADSPVSDAAAPFVIGVYGDSGVFTALEKVASRTRIKGKPIETRRITSVTDLDRCQIVFLSESKRAQISEVLGQTKGKPILTIAESEGLARRGIMINFKVEGTSIRFEINESAAEASGLRLAPKLLTLGTPI